MRDKVAIITGGGRGIGWGCAKLFAQQGMQVILTGKSSQADLESKASELTTRYHTECAAFLCDVSKMDDVNNFYRQIYKRYKKLDILVNNAGIMENALLPMCSQQHIDHVIDTNLKGTIYNTQFAAKLMIRNQAGSIVNISSIIGTKGYEGQSVYSASKAAIVGLTMSAAKELGHYNIRVNAICPGFIETDLTAGFSDSQKEKIRDSISLQRLGRPEDIARTVLFLCSEQSSYITGQVIGVDGGMRI